MRSIFTNRIKYMVFIAIALCVLLPLLSHTAMAAEEDGDNVIRVAFPYTDGFTMTAPDGTRYGLVVDFLNEIAKYTGWKYEYIDTTVAEMLEGLPEGTYDLLGGQYYLKGMEEYFLYPDYNCGYGKLILLARRDDPNIKNYDLNSFNGKTIGVLDRARENIRRLELFLELNDLDCTLKYYSYDQLMQTDTQSLVPFLENGDVDLLLGNSADAGDSLYIAASFESQPHYIVTSKDRPDILEGLNMALRKIYEADPDFAEKVYKVNFPAVGNPQTLLNEEEQAYIKQKQTVTIAAPRNWHPIVCLESNDEHDGLIPDMLKEITKYSGLEFTYLFCDTYADAVSQVQQGNADILGCFLGSEEDASHLGLAMTTPYAELNSILVRNKESSYPGNGLTGGVIKGQSIPDGIMAETIRYYPDAGEALLDVSKGKIDFFYGVSSHIERILQKDNYSNLVLVGSINDSLHAGFALTSPVQPELFSILNKAINNLSSDEKALMASRNLVSIGDATVSLSSLIYSNPKLVIMVISAFLLLILGIVIVISRSRLRAATMQSELKKAEAASKAKSDFLSRMSHEIRTPMNAIIGLTDLTAMMKDLPEKALENLSKIKASSQYLLNLINDILDMSRIANDKMEISSEPFSMNALAAEIENIMGTDAVIKGLHFELTKSFQHDVVAGDAIRLRQVILNLLSNAFKFTPSGGSVRLLVQETSSTGEDVTFCFQVEDTGVGIAAEDQQRIFDSFEQVGSNVSKSQGTGLGLSICKNIVQLMGGELLLTSEPGVGSRFTFTVTLPKSRLEEGSETEVKKNLLQDLNILVAEDNELNAEIIAELLRTQGARVCWVENGRVAVDVFASSHEGEYQAILMDILMPQMNGLKAASTIRSLSHPDAKTIPIIAMTANAFQEDKQAALNAGMTGFLSKPVDISLLYKELLSEVQGLS